MQLERLTFVYQFLSQGGVEVLLRSRARELVRRGVDVQLLFLEAFGGEGLFEDMGDRVLVTGDKTEFLEALDRFEPDWVLSLDTPSVVPWVRSSYPESGLLYEVHSTYPASLAPLLDPDVLAGANGLLVPSPSQRELVKSLHTRPMPVRTVPDCLDDRFFGATEPIETGGPPIVAWIGRLDALKNWEGFIELVRLVRRRCEIEIWLIGGNKATTSEKERLERLVREYGLARDFRWRPHVESSDMPKIYKSIAARGGCLVSTSWAESFGLVVLEAMACRCPVVVPDVIGLCDLVEDRENGLVYPPIQVELGCERVVELVSSPALRASVSERAREFAGRFRRGPVVDRLVQVLECWDQGDDRDSDDGLSPFFEATRFQGGKGVLTRKRAFQAFTGQTIRAHRDHQHEVGERDGTIRGLQEELHQKVGERDKTIEHLQSRIADFELDASEVPRLAAECDTLKGEIAALTGRLEQAEEQRGEAFSQRDALKEQTAALTARMTLAEEQRGEAFSQRDALKEQTAALTGRLEQAEEQRVEAHAQILQQTERETEHRILITSLEDQIKDIAEDREGVVARYERLNADHEEILAELHSIHGSRLWKIASLYWRVLEKMGRMPVTAEKQQGGNLPVERASSTSRPTSSTRDAVATGLPVAAVDRENTHDVLCLPIIDWEFRFQRPQQLMSRFAENGNRVYYLAQAFRKGGAPFVIDEKRKNVFEIGLRGRKLDVYGDVLDDGAVDELVQSIEALRIEEGIRAAAMIVQLPFWWPLAERLRSDLGWPIVYDCMDFHGGFSTNKAGMLDQERELLQRADLVVVSSSMLESEAKTFCSDPLMVRNGCDFDHFATVGVRQPGERLVVGYFGAIADWFDSDLVADLAERRPDWSFVLVGSTFTAETARLKKLSNVTMPGEQPYDSIPSWVDGFDVLILPFKRVPLTEATNPVKAYEILATGKPLISVPIPEIIPLAPLVRLASDAVEFEREILASITNNDLDQVEARRSFARENTWQRRFEVFGPAVFRAFPKATIIVVTYKKEELTEACLESIRAHTLWPNYEVIVVDNASDDGTPELLQEFARSVPNIRVILNDKNLGFAAANNQGLRIAEGQFLILLNNDTVVTRGWLSGLIRHLVKNPGTGILGPVTNEIGNEAKIEVGYSNLEEMPAWADEHTRKNYEVFFSIPVLAMFCLAMRRETFETVGLLDERFGVGMFEDDDFSGRVRQAGYDVVCTEDVFVHHVGRAAFSQMKKDDYDRVFLENRRKYEEKWGNEWVPHKYRDW